MRLRPAARHGRGAFRGLSTGRRLLPEPADVVVIDLDACESGEDVQADHDGGASGERPVAAAACREEPHDSGAADDADAEVAAYLVAFGRSARCAAVGDVLAVVADEVVGQVREVGEEELGPGDDLVRGVGWREPPAGPACPPVPDGLGDPAGVELLERDGFDGRVRLVEDPAAELDDAVVADVDAVVVVAEFAADLEVVSWLEGAVHAAEVTRG